MRVLGLDVGSKTIGVAVADPTGLIATARTVLPRRGHTADAAAIAQMCATESAGAVVVGLPFELDGSVGHRARLVQGFITVLAAALGDIPVHTWDERFSTAAAERTLIDADVSRDRRRRTIDALAAQFILQGWLDARRIAAARREGAA